MKNLTQLFASATLTLMTCVVGLAQPTWTLEETCPERVHPRFRGEHPLGIDVGPDDMLWCTTWEGDVLRIDPASGLTTPCLNST